MGGVLGEDGVDDVDDGLVLPDAAGAALREPPQPGHEADAVARQAAFAIQESRLADEAGKAGAAAVCQTDVKRGAAAYEARQGDVGIRGEHEEVAIADGLQALGCGDAFDQQAARAEGVRCLVVVACRMQGQLVQARVGGKER